MEQHEKYIIWDDADFSEGNVRQTMKRIGANKDQVHLLSASANLPLHEAINRLGQADDEEGMTITKARLAYDLQFALPVEVCRIDGASGVSLGRANRLKEVLDVLPLNENGGMEMSCRIVIDDDDVDAEQKDATKAMIAELFQQFVFLNLDLDIVSKSEIRKNIVKERFRRRYTEIKEELEKTLQGMAEILSRRTMSEASQETAEAMYRTLQEVEPELEKARKRPIRIAAMGTKKAGKSVIINSLLKQEYAPTSSELPTPNVIQYVPEPPDGNLWLEYKDRSLTFASADELRSYIQKEFEEAQKHTGEGSGLEDMIVHYPASGLAGFEIYDTPGPNFAGAGEEHERIAEECIEKADVCIFVMNYSNHLTTDEVNFLKKIRDSFEQSGKFYSLLIAINRIDERYNAEVEKSVTRLVDYIRKRLGELDYPNIVTFGTSALQSFYLEKIRQICVEAGENRDLVITGDVVSSLKKTNRKWMTQLRFIETSLGNLEDFHDYDTPTDRDLDRMSGVPQLRRYVRYIGEQKADLEIVDHVISACEMKSKVVKNALEVTKLTELRENDAEKIEKLSYYIGKLQTEVNRILHSLDHAVSEDTKGAAKNWVRENSEDNEEKACATARDRIEAMFDRMRFSEGDMRLIYDGNSSDKLLEIRDKTKDTIEGINKEMENVVHHGMRTYCEGRANLFRETLEDVQAQIQAEVEAVDRELEQEKDVQEMFRAFELPEFPVGVEFPTTATTGIDNGFDSDRVWKLVSHHRHARVEEREAKGIVETVKSFFGEKFYETHHDYDVKGFVDRIKQSATDRALQAIREVNHAAAAEQEEQVAAYIDSLSEQRRKYEEDYANIFRNYTNTLQLLLDDTEEHREAVQRDIEAFTQMWQVAEPFFSLLGDVIQKPMREN